MNTMKEFAKDHKMITDIGHKLRDARDQYSAGLIQQQYDHLPINVDELKQKVTKLREEEKTVWDAYAKHVFEYFSPMEPELIRDVTGERISWKEAFGDSFDVLDTGLRNSLVALIEKNGGQYRLL